MSQYPDEDPPPPDDVGWRVMYWLTVVVSTVTLALLIRACMLAGEPHL